MAQKTARAPPATSAAAETAASADALAAAQVPASVTVLEGQTTATFQVTTTPVAIDTPVVISATYNSATQTANLTVTAPVAVLSGVSLDPITVLGGVSSTGTVTLDIAAPVGGALVALSSDNAAAQVPANVTVPEGQTTATFQVTTTPVAAVTPVVITATYNSATQTANLTVTAPVAVLSGVSLDPITVLAGDMYSNPVAPGTAIYFRSSAGVVQPTVFTDKNGFGSVNLYSGNPKPLGSFADPTNGNGYHYVVARTLGQGGIAVEDSTLILWSGEGAISNVSPLSFDIANAGSQQFSFRVADALGHPLAAGTIISVSAVIPPPPSDGIQQNQVSVLFGANGSVTLPDVLFAGSGTTDFTFILKDGTWSITDATPVNVVINVTGPNVQNAIGFTLKNSLSRSRGSSR